MPHQKKEVKQNPRERSEKWWKKREEKNEERKIQEEDSNQGRETRERDRKGGKKGHTKEVFKKGSEGNRKKCKKQD